MVVKKNKFGELIFKDYPEFRPNLSPSEIFKLGSFGGTYWRPIYSSVNKTDYEDQHLEFPKLWWKNIPKNWLITEWDNYDKKINKYGEKVGTTLEFWEDKDWIDSQDPYGWVQWYCRFYEGRRTDDDERQIDRWKSLASQNGRFRKWLVTQILKKGGKYDDFNISPKIRQTLQHWAYVLTEKDFDYEVNDRK